MYLSQYSVDVVLCRRGVQRAVFIGVGGSEGLVLFGLDCDPARSRGGRGLALDALNGLFLELVFVFDRFDAACFGLAAFGASGTFGLFGGLFLLSSVSEDIADSKSEISAKEVSNKIYDGF